MDKRQQDGPPAEFYSSIMSARASRLSQLAAESSASAESVASAAAEASAVNAAISDNVDASTTAAETSVGLDSATTIDIGATPTDSSSVSETSSVVPAETSTSETGVMGGGAATSSTQSTASAQSTPATTPAPTTFSISTHSAGSAVSENAPMTHDSSALPTPTTISTSTSYATPVAHGFSALSPGAKAAVVIFPLLIALALLFAIPIFLRRRRNRRNATAADASRAELMPPMAMLGKGGHRSTPSTAPIITNDQNRSYYTGLDTSSSRMSSQRTRGPSGESQLANGTFYEPPPAYKKPTSSMEAEMIAASTGSPPGYSHALPPALVLPTISHDSDNSPFDPFNDPPSPVASVVSPLREAPEAAGGLAVAERPGTSRSHSAMSVTSDAYSDTASVHSARAARRSVGGAVFVARGRGSDPFADERRSGEGSGEVSPI